MRYLTKEWFRMMQYAEAGNRTEASEEAGSCSEAFFQKCYAAKEEERLSFKKSLIERADKQKLMDLISGTSIPMCRIDGLPATPEEQQVALVFQEAMKATLAEWEKPVFDEAAEKCEFRKMFGKSLECIHLFYPPEILEKVADPRVLSLGYATPGIVQEMAELRKKYRCIVKERMQACDAAREAAFPEGVPQELKSLRFHDERISHMRWENGDLIMSFGGQWGCTFKQAEILLQDKPIEGLEWLYVEYYPCKEGYEVHVLLADGNETADFVVRCRGIEVMDGFYTKIWRDNDD